MPFGICIEYPPRHGHRDTLLDCLRKEAESKVMAVEEARRLFEAQGTEPDVMGPDAFAEAVREESARWAPAVKASGTTLA